MKGKHTIKLDKDAVREAMEQYLNARLTQAVVSGQSLTKVTLHKSGQITLQLEPKDEPVSVSADYDHQRGGYTS